MKKVVYQIDIARPNGTDLTSLDVYANSADEAIEKLSVLYRGENAPYYLVSCGPAYDANGCIRIACE